MGQIEYTHFDHNLMNIARIYLRVSTDEQDLSRQNDIERNTRDAGYYIAGAYRKKASGARIDRPELQRMAIHVMPRERAVMPSVYDAITIACAALNHNRFQPLFFNEL
jgi:hypothetical protein